MVNSILTSEARQTQISHIQIIITTQVLYVN